MRLRDRITFLSTCRRIAGTFCVTALYLMAVSSLFAQKPPDPEVGYIYPPGGARGATVDVKLAGFDWTPDLQYFVLDSRIKLEVDGGLSRHLMPTAPFPIGMRAYGPPPLPREVAARITIPADYPPGPVRWQVANANGASSTGIFLVGDGPEVHENRPDAEPQRLNRLPITVSGRLACYEEVDRYDIEATADGPVTCELFARRLGANFHGVIEVRDAEGRLIADAVDSQGADIALTFAASAGRLYRVCVRDLSFRGHRACVYRLAISEGPRVLATIPAAGRRGETRDVEFIGYGLQTGRCEIERTKRTVAFPEARDSSEVIYQLKTESGKVATVSIPLSDIAERVASARTTVDPPVLELPGAVTGVLDRAAPVCRYRVAGMAGEVWTVEAQAHRIGSPLDLSIAIVGPDGKELATNDDLPGTTDAGLEFVVPANGAYDVDVGDVSGAGPSALNLYRLVVRRAEPDFTLQVPQHANVPIGEKTELLVTATRIGGFKGPIAVSMTALPEGLSVPDDLSIAADQAELKIPLQSAADAPSGAGVATITGSAEIGNRRVTRTALAQAAGNLAPRTPEGNAVSSLLVASTMKPVVAIRPIETDERTVHRGTFHMAELAIERQPGFDGEVIVQMDSRQPVKFRQGILGPDIVVPPGADRVFYPCLLPDRAETTDAYRILLEAVAMVPDTRGRTRYLVSKMKADDASVAITVEGALLKISVVGKDFAARGGATLQIPLRIARSAKLAEPVRLEVRTPAELAGRVQADAIVVPSGETEVTVPIRLAAGLKAGNRFTLGIRATVLRTGNVPLISDSAGATPMEAETLALLKAGYLPVVAETGVTVDVLGER